MDRIHGFSMLDALVAANPGELRAERTAESARQFDQATPATAADDFQLLAERFADLFMATDKDLLADTQGLVTAANLLNTHLQGLLT